MAFGSPRQSKSMTRVPAGPSRQYPTVTPPSAPIGIIRPGVMFRRIDLLALPASCASARAMANPPVPASMSSAVEEVVSCK